MDHHHHYHHWHDSPLWAIAFLGFPDNRIFTCGAVNPTPNPNLEDQASVFVTPGDRMTQLYPQALGTHFNRLLRHAWATSELFESSGHHTEKKLCITEANYDLHLLKIWTKLGLLPFSTITNTDIEIYFTRRTCSLKGIIPWKYEPVWHIFRTKNVIQ
jgi:hypothetical protein